MWQRPIYQAHQLDRPATKEELVILRTLANVVQEFASSVYPSDSQKKAQELLYDLYSKHA